MGSDEDAALCGRYILKGVMGGVPVPEQASCLREMDDSFEPSAVAQPNLQRCAKKAGEGDPSWVQLVISLRPGAEVCYPS